MHTVGNLYSLYSSGQELCDLLTMNNSVLTYVYLRIISFASCVYNYLMNDFHSLGTQSCIYVYAFGRVSCASHDVPCYIIVYEQERRLLLFSTD